MYPTELYPGENVLTFYNPDGIQEFKPAFDSLTASKTELEILDVLADCPDSIVVRVKVNTVHDRLLSRFVVTSCSKMRQVLTLRNYVWFPDRHVFPDVQVGDTVCQRFEVGSGGQFPGEGEFIESITVSTPQAFLVFPPDSIPPLFRLYEHTYGYNVCFVGDVPNNYTFHVVHQIRRMQPAGGFTNYQVADTGVVRVVPRKSKESPSPGERQ